MSESTSEHKNADLKQRNSARNGAAGKVIKDNRSELIAQRETIQRMCKKCEEEEEGTAQLQANNTGMPDNLKSGLESLSGMDMSDVRVHYNSPKPAQLNAHAYAQGSNIHLAPGQEKHLPHEAWHTVQQKQGRVNPTTKVNGANVNDSKSLESEADVMGSKASQMKRIKDS